MCTSVSPRRRRRAEEASVSIQTTLGRVWDWIRGLVGGSDDDLADTRARLVTRKHALEGEIRSLQREARNLSARGEDVSVLESTISAKQAEHYRLRLEIDRTR